MSLSAPVRRLASRCLSSTPPIAGGAPRIQRRTAMSDFFRRGSKTAPTSDDVPSATGEDAAQLQPKAPSPGDIAPGSIFEDDRRIQEQREREAGAAQGEEQTETKVAGVKRDPRTMARVLNPDPNARERWERKKVIQMVRKGGRLNREQFLKRTEREHVAKSHNMKTSIKKLGMLARQIAGKPIDEAIVQMRFSKKKAAVEVLKQLEFVRDEAVVMRGMGLGSVTPTAAASESISLSTADAPSPAERKPIDIQLKDGSRHRVTDTRRIYIDQAWVGRGPYGQLPDYRARGRVFIMRTPWTSISVVLKEEATRVREYAEREAKRLKQRTQNVWVPLPDRPIQTHRQWYSW